MKPVLIFILGLILASTSAFIAYGHYQEFYEILALWLLSFGGLFMYYAMILLVRQ